MPQEAAADGSRAAAPRVLDLANIRAGQVDQILRPGQQHRPVLLSDANLLQSISQVEAPQGESKARNVPHHSFENKYAIQATR